MSECCSPCVDKCVNAIKRYEWALNKKSKELRELEMQTGKLQGDLLNVMSRYDTAMIELEKNLETDYYNTLAKMYTTTLKFTAEFNQLSGQIDESEERYAAQNDEYLKMVDKFYRDVRKCPDYKQA